VSKNAPKIPSFVRHTWRCALRGGGSFGTSEWVPFRAVTISAHLKGVPFRGVAGLFEVRKRKDNSGFTFPFEFAEADSSGMTTRKVKTKPNSPSSGIARAPAIAIKDLLNGEVDGGGLDDGAAGGGYVDRVGAGGEAAWAETVGVDSAAAAAAEHTEGGEREEKG
jgi:hypothetical protein